MLTIRLSRIGKKNKPMYRLVISEKARDPYGKALEILGSYNPYKKELTCKQDRIEYWLSQGSQMSATVNNLLVEKGIIKGEKVKASRARKKKKKGEESTEEKADKETNKTEKAETVPQKEVGAEDKKEEDKTETKEEAKEETKEK
jgi:small subunit ribosomal protein S16